MAKDFAVNPTCSMKVDVFTNSQGNIIHPCETVAGKKTFTFSRIKSDVTIDETINTEDSPAIHNGIAGLIWLLSCSD